MKNRQNIHFSKVGKCSDLIALKWASLRELLGRRAPKNSTPFSECFFRCFLLNLQILHECLGPWTFWMIVFEQMQNTHLGQCYLWNQLFFSRRREFAEMLYKREGSSVSFQEKKSSPLRFCFTKYFATLWKSINVGQCYLWKQRVWFWKKGTLGTKLFKQAPFFTKQAHFSRKCEFPCQAFSHDNVFSS